MCSPSKNKIERRGAVTMSKRVLSVGQCSVDHAALWALLEDNFAAEVVPAETAADALACAGAGEIRPGDGQP